MSLKNKQRRYYKKICVHLLLLEIVMCSVLIVCTLGLQVYTLISPPDINPAIPSQLGGDSLPFHLTTANCFPFLMLPMLLLIFGALLLQDFFAHNSFGFNDNIPFFNKYPHTRYGRKFCIGYIIIISVCSVVLSVIVSAVHSIHTLWFGTFIVMVTSSLCSACSKMLRHRRRQYFHNKTKEKV